MKNSSALGALVLIGLAVTIGAYALQSETDPLETELVEAPTGQRRAAFRQDLSPQERRKKNNMEEAQRYLAKVRREGVEVSPDLYRIKDDDGTPLYVVGHLTQGFDAFGEPKYLLQKIKRSPMLPFDPSLPLDLPEELQPKIAAETIQAEFLTKPEDGKGGRRGTSNAKKKKKNKNKNKDTAPTGSGDGAGDASDVKNALGGNDG